MADQPYDVAIIGAGPGGYVAGIRAGQLGLRAVVVEREASLGGVCLNWGCIPTKALVHNAEVVRLLTGKADELGLGFDAPPRFDWRKAVSRSRQVVKRMSRGVEGLLKKQKVDVVHGQARFADAHSLVVEGGAVDRLEAAHIIIATGSRSRLLPGMTADGQRILTSRHAVQLDAVPGRLLVMGAGPVGMEFAYVYAAYGAEVTVIEMLDRVLPLEDAEAGALVARRFEMSGIRIRTATRVEQVAPTDTGVRLTVTAGGEEEVLEGDKVLVAIGRVPNSDNLGLEAVGVTTDHGWIRIGPDRRTAVPHIFAIGDVVGPPLLAHKASHEAVQVVEQLAGLDTYPVNASLIPSCTHCHPQVASVGLTEAQAREAGHEVKVGRFPFLGIGKAVAIGEHEGWVKLVSDARYGEILGATIVGPQAAELIHEIALARTAELTAAELVATIHAHPTLAEAIHEAALAVDGRPLHI